MASYQEIEARLEVLERKLKFVLSTAQAVVELESKIMGIDGQPQKKLYKATLSEIYNLTQSSAKAENLNHAS